MAELFRRLEEGAYTRVLEEEMERVQECHTRRINKKTHIGK